VSTRRVERLAEQLGVKSLSRSQVIPEGVGPVKGLSWVC
jgi:hypothetical protein